MVPDAQRAPKPKWRDHAQVAWLLVCTVGALIPIVVFVVFSPLLTPWIRARLRRRLQEVPQPPIDPAPIDPARWKGRSIFIVAGEPSGDRLGARVLLAMRRMAPDADVSGYGGPALAAAGARLHCNLMEHAVIGAWAVMRTVGFWWRLCAETLARFREEPPDLCLTIDFPGLNVRIARWARRRGARTVHVVAPQLWAHQPWRIYRWRRAVDRIVATFPYEPALFRKSGIPTTYVGHPLFEAPLPPPRTPTTWPGGAQAVIEVWPGSRGREIRHHAPMLLKAARRIRQRMPSVSFVVRLAEAAHETRFRDAAGDLGDLPFTFVTQPVEDGPPLLGALACSGTATAQLATDLVPMVAFYHASRPVRVVAWLALSTPWFLLPNVIAGRELVRENLYTSPSTGTRIADQFLEVVATPPTWAAMRQGLSVVRERMEASDVAERAARVILSESPSS